MSTDDPKGRDTVRELARRLAEHAHSKENEQRLALWCDVNSLRLPERPPVICSPGQPAWEEMLPKSTVLSTAPNLAALEYNFRKTIYKCEILKDDTVVDPWIPVGAAMRLEGDHLWGLPVKHIKTEHEDIARTAWQYDPPIKEQADIERIVPPRYRYDKEATQRNLSAMDDLLGDILPVKQTGVVPGPGAWLHGWATQLRGVEQLLFDMMDRPEWVHRLMGILRDGFLGVMDQYEEAGVLTLNNIGRMACDDLPQADFDGEHVRLCDLWGRGESQEFQGVSPALYEEFLLAYQKPILARSGLTFYGCCEDLTNKIDMVLSVPNLRKFVCSAWTDLGKLADAVRGRCCIEWRQKATDVVYAPNLDDVRRHLEEGLRLAHGCPIQIILQELETTDHNPQRLTDWTALAKEVGAAYAG